MSGAGPVDPVGIPVFTGDLALLDTKVTALSGHGAKVAGAAGDVHRGFGGLRAFYRAPEAEQLFATTGPVAAKGQLLSSDLCVIAGALGTYSDDAFPLVERLKELKRDAVAFRVKVDGDDRWSEDGDLVEENNRRRGEIAEVWAAFQEVERACHARIVALVGGTALKAGDGSGRPGTYGYDAEALKQAKSLPWGEAVEESTPWWQVWEHAYDFGRGFLVDGVWGTLKGLGTLAGFGGGDAAEEAWTGLAKLATGLSPAAQLVLHALPGDHSAWLRDSNTAVKETGKALIAWDQWGSNPSRAAGAVTFNVLTTVFTGGTGGATSDVWGSFEIPYRYSKFTRAPGFGRIGYARSADGEVQYVPVHGEHGLLGYLWASDAENAASFEPRDVGDEESYEAGLLCLDRLRSAHDRGLPPSRVLTELAGLTDDSRLNTLGLSMLRELASEG
ncbi:hypothetical protein ACF07T_20270 [Streptomyces sp. NPDC015184]|uniref:hypothetical protein n=1 Tax=Streptomyces sp. NPDC015184 TaxID=3364946 RepID=UPI0036FF77AE